MQICDICEQLFSQITRIYTEEFKNESLPRYMTTLFNHSTKNDFEKQYILLREKEGRMYTDKQVARLPDIEKEHLHYKEWKLRKLSSKKLISYLERKNRALDILEVGCGNGWLSHQLSRIRYTNVTGIDINETELLQASRVFYYCTNLEFIYGTLDSSHIQKRRFDSIVFAASFHYFPSVASTLNNALALLKPKGEIHIIDTHWYKKNELVSAKERSADYYRQLGFPEMTNLYFHCCLDDLQSFRYTLLYNPFSLLDKLVSQASPFQWIRLVKK